MSLLTIRNVLETRLNAMSPALATAWENTKFIPTEGIPYQRAYLLPAEPENPEMGAMVREQGIFQVTLCYPLSNGPAAAAARAELIRATFPRKLSLVSGGVTVTVERTPEVGPAMYEPDRYTLPIRIRWYSNSST